MPSKSSHDPKTVLTNHRDVPLLHFLWRWKVSTTSALAARFFPDLAVWTAYKRLWRLEKSGYIRARSDETATDFLWTLDRKGFAFVRSQMPKMIEEGYLSENLKHDAIVSAIHLGDGLLTQITGLQYFSEQELRRIDPDLFPLWVPKTTRHRPDGYWHFATNDSQKLISLEVELSQKPDNEYEKVGRFYDDHTEIYRAIWVVEGTRFAEKIQQLFSKVTRKQEKHSFVILKTVYSKGWEAKIFLGPDTGKSIAGVIANLLPTASQPVAAQLLLDTRKAPHKSKNCRFVGTPSFSY